MNFNTLATGIYANSAAALPSSRESGQSTVSDAFREEAERLWSEAAKKANGSRSDGEEEENPEPDLIEQLADPGSAFYQDMFQRIKLRMEMSDEEKKEQAIIDALDSILEGMRSSDRPDKRTDMATSMANLSKEISQLDKTDPRRAQLDLFRQRLNHLGMYMDLGESIFGGSGKNDGLTLTQQLIREKTEGFDPSAFDLY